MSEVLVLVDTFITQMSIGEDVSVKTNMLENLALGRTSDAALRGNNLGANLASLTVQPVHNDNDGLLLNLATFAQVLVTRLAAYLGFVNFDRLQ